MQYYSIKINSSYSENIIQVKNVPNYLRQEKWNLNKIDFVKHVHTPFNFTPLFVYQLDNGSMFTDILFPTSLGYSLGLMCNEKVLSVLSDFRLLEYDIYNHVEIYYQMKPLTFYAVNRDYKWIHFISRNKLDFDFKNSRFISKKKTGGDKKYIEINSYEEYLSKQSDMHVFRTIDFEELYLKNSEYFDLFRLHDFNNSLLYISENLKNKLEEENITGAVFEKAFFCHYVNM